MRLFTWESFSVNKRSVNRLFSLIFAVVALLFCVEAAYTSDRVASITVEGESDNFKIRDTNQSNEEIGKFKIDIINETIRLTGDGLEFNVKITSTIDVVIKYENEKIEKTDEGIIFTECIEYKDLYNHVFHKVLQFSSEKQNLSFDKVNLRIEPIIQLKASSKYVNFGTICWNEGYVTASKSPTVDFSYSVLRDTTCKVESKNGFKLKLKNENKNEFIEYSLKIQGAAKQDLNIDEKNEFKLSNQGKESSVQFNIATFMKHIPSSGLWEDTITFSIVCDK